MEAVIKCMLCDVKYMHKQNNLLPAIILIMYSDANR